MSCTASILLWDLFLPFTGCPDRSETRETFPRTDTIGSHNSRAGKPFDLSPVSREIISDSVELWETAVCFLHIQFIGPTVWLPKTHNVPPEVDFESSRSPAKSESWNSPNLHSWAVFSTYAWNQSIQAFGNRFWVHFVIDRASLFTDHRISGLPIRAKYEHFRTFWEHTCDSSDFISYSLKWWSSMHGVKQCEEMLSRFVSQLTISLHTLLCMTSHVIRPWRNTKILRKWWFLCSERCWFSQINFFIEYFPHKINVVFLFPTNFLSSTCTDESNPFPRCTMRHSQFGIFSRPCFNRIFSNCLSHYSLAKRWPYKFLSKGTTGSSMLDHDSGHLCRGGRIQLSGHSDFEILIYLWVSSIFTWVLADTASAACLAHPGSLEMISMILTTVIWDAEDPFSANTA